MDTFEDENPFEDEGIQSTPPSASRVDFSSPSSPPTTYNPTPSSPPSSSNRPPFPSSGSHRLPQAYKSDYCCIRDQWLHSGEDVEIMVRITLTVVCLHQLILLRTRLQITDAQKTSVNSTSPYITYIIRSGVSFLVSYSSHYDSY